VDAGGRQQWATATRTSSYLSAGDARAHFGLGAAAEVELVEIRWPSGVVQRIERPRIDRVIDVAEAGQ
jgi:hypothetical protein